MTTGGPEPIAPFDRPSGTSPWAPGGAPAEGFELQTDAVPATPGDGSSPIVFDSPTMSPPDEGDDRAEGFDDGHASPVGRGRRLAIAGAVVGVVAVAVIGSLVLGGTDLSGEVTATASDLDADTSDISETSDAQVGPTTEPGDEADGETLPGLSDDAAGDPNDPDGDGIPLRVDVPEPLASLTTPTEIIALTEDGRHVTVSLPSGVVHVAPIEISASAVRDLFFSARLVATPSFSVFDNGSGIVIVDRLGGVSEVDRSAVSIDGSSVQPSFPLGVARLADGTDVAVLAATDEFGLRAVIITLSVEGDVAVTDLDARAPFFGSFPAVFDDGAVVVEDGGLVVRRPSIDAPATTLGAGELLGGGSGGVVIHRCDAPDSCVTELVDETGRPILTVDPSLVDVLRAPFFGGPVLSPSGEAVLVRGPTGDLPPNQAWIQSIRLEDGAVTPIVGSSDVFSGEFPDWLSDGSAVVGRPEGGNGSDPFPDEPGIAVFPLDPDVEPFLFAEEIGTVLSLTTRYPDEELPIQAPVATTAVEGVPLSAVGLPPVVVADTAGVVSRIDFSVGEVTSWRAGLTPGWATGNGAQVLRLDPAGDVPDPDVVLGSTVVIDGPGDDALAIVGDEIAAPPAWPNGPRYEHNLKLVWAPVPDPDGDRSATTYQLVDEDSIQRNSVQIPASTVIGADGAGGIVHSIAGDVWVTDFDTTTRLTSGDVWALNATTVLAQECDADLVCDSRLIDRTSGERRSAGSSFGRLALPALPGRSVTLDGTLSPDGRWALVELAEPLAADVGTDWAFVDFETTTLIPAETPDDLHPVIWSDDGEVALYVSGRELRLFEAATTRVVGIDGGLGGFDDVAAMGPALS